MKYTFLHISDFHHKPNWFEENQMVCNKFIDDITKQVKNYDNTYLVFSGDIVYESNSTAYQEFESDFASRLDKAGLPKTKRICVPGNHDVSRDILIPLSKIQKATLSDITNEKMFNDDLPQNSKSFLASKFDNYKEYEYNFAEYTSCQSNISGYGWELSSEIGVYCLNTALCSSAGIFNISDQNKLMIDTRSLYEWIIKNDFKTRILVMHHPLDWLTEWAKLELEKIISSSFQLVFCGHIHENSATFSTRGMGKSIHCVAPPLFTRKSQNLGYSFVTIDTSNGKIEVDYRQWSPSSQVFVKGTGLAGNDMGQIVFNINETNHASIDVSSAILKANDTLTILQSEFDEARTCYSSLRRLYVERDLANMPETHSDRENLVKVSQDDLIKEFRSCRIRAPKEFGLTCFGYFLALEHFCQNTQGKVLILLDTNTIPKHRQGVIDHVATRCKDLNILQSSIAGFILDNWQNNKETKKVLRELKVEYQNAPIMLFESIDDCLQIGNVIDIEDNQIVETFYLWSLTRSRIRELVSTYIDGESSLDEDLVTNKIISDIDALNIHRTPLNCLLILSLLEKTFDDSPVNRTELIGRVLHFLFYKFDDIPKYSNRPDLKDCEYALGYFCEWLIRDKKTSFSKQDFCKKVQECFEAQNDYLDDHVLFAFLAKEHIFVKKGLEFEFRFNYWLYFFAAHRMHHSTDFAKFIMTDRRYSAFPEIIEFYAGIDRRRSDVVMQLTEDLKLMNMDFLRRTGIPEDFNPLKQALWTPKNDSLEKLKKEVDNSISKSALPTEVKDAVADQSYNQARPYNQALANFIEESSLIQMVQAMKGAARVLRNSNYVPSQAKITLLEEVINCWIRVCQIVVILSPILAQQREVAFEGMGFVLYNGLDEKSVIERWEVIMTVIPDNIVDWFQDDIFSKKMGGLFAEYNKSHNGSLGELLILLVMVKQRPPSWEKEVERFIKQEQKNSFYLSRIFHVLMSELEYGFWTERHRLELRRLAGMSLAKHDLGVKSPNQKVIEKAANAIDERIQAKQQLN
jgi:predicted MPP superfamily phosphohydrolase